MELAKSYQILLQDEINLYLPIEFDIEKKDLRSTDKSFQREIDENIRYFLDVTKTNYHIITGTPEERVKKVLEIINV